METQETTEKLLDSWEETLKPNANTRRIYKHAAKRFLGWMEETGRVLEDFDEDGFAAYKISLMEAGLSAASVNLNLSAARSLLKHKGHKSVAKSIDNEPVRKVPKREFLEKEDIYDLLATCKKGTEVNTRDYAMINLMIRTGLREKEVAEALIGDLERRGENATLWVRGKGHTDKDDYVLLFPKSLAPIDKYLEEYRKGAKADEPLFTATSNRSAGKALAPKAISRIIKERLRRIGFDDSRYTGHSLRHTAITLALEAGANPKQVQIMARHADPGTTQIYTHDYERRKHSGEAFIEEFLDD